MADDDAIDAELARRARDAWDDPEVEAPRESHVNRDNDAQIIAWAFHHGLLP